MRKIIVNAFAFFLGTFAVTSLGGNLTSWQYWVVLASLLTVQINSQID